MLGCLLCVVDGCCLFVVCSQFYGLSVVVGLLLLHRDCYIVLVVCRCCVFAFVCCCLIAVVVVVDWSWLTVVDVFFV